MIISVCGTRATMSYLNPRPHGKWLQKDYDRASSQRGTAEYLNSLLTGPDHSCPHTNKKKTKEMPHRMGFFRQTDGTHTYLDTAKVCQQCYDLAIPEGFNVWSTAYKASANPMTPENRARLEGDGTLSGNWAALSMPSARGYYPPMFQAGTEDGPDPRPVTDRLLPTNAEATELWRYLQHEGKPFYVDQLHLTRPWNPNAPDQRAEDRRVARENHLAYANAAQGFVGTGIGGAGVNTIVEQRILGDRAQEFPGRFGSSPYLAGPYEPFTGTPDVGRNIQDEVWIDLFPHRFLLTLF